jgi:nitrogen fixation protein NifB
MYPVANTPFEKLEELAPAEINRLRTVTGRYLPQMNHCTRCRADAAGMLGATQSVELAGIMRACATGNFEAHQHRPYVAVASMEGVLVNQHLGEAWRLWIFEQGTEGLRLIETRKTPEVGGGNLRWLELAESLRDCRALLVSGVGRNPRQIIERKDIRIFEMAGLISEGIASLYRTGDVPRTMRKHFTSCGAECQGSGMGCS